MRSVLLILASLCSFQASAEVYKCVVASGNTVYQSSPCVSGASKTEINTKTGVSTNLNALEIQQQTQQQSQQEQLEKEKAEKEQAERIKAQRIQDALNEIEKNKELIRSNHTHFSAYAIPPYMPDKLPPFIKTFEERLPEIERFRRLAAEKALATQQCERVEADELNIRSTKAALVFLVDCSSGKKFYYTEQELSQ